MTTGEPIVVSVAMKPISTLMKPLRSVNVETKEPFKAEVIRSDVTAVPAHRHFFQRRMRACRHLHVTASGSD